MDLKEDIERLSANIPRNEASQRKVINDLSLAINKKSPVFTSQDRSRFPNILMWLDINRLSRIEKTNPKTD